MDAISILLAFAGALALAAAAVVWMRPELCRRLAVVLLARAHAVEVQRVAMATALREYGEEHGGER